MFAHENFSNIETAFNNVYIGVVEDNDDPDKLGRCRTRILGLHTSKKIKEAEEGIPTNELPWAIPANPISGGSVSGLGLNGVPVQGSWVAIFFIGGNHNFPVYFASIGGNPTEASDTSKGFNDPDGVYPSILNEPDWNKYARSGALNAEKNGNLETFEPSSAAAPVYPKNTVFETPDSGIIVEYDSSPGAERWHVYHKASKAYMEIKANGDTIFKSTNDHYEITANNRKVFVKTNDTQQIDGNVAITIGGTLGITVGGNVTLTSTGGTINVDANGKATVKGDEVEIDGGGGTITGVVCKQNICPLLGSPHIDASTKVTASQ